MAPFSDYYEAIIRNSIKILIVCYFISLSYESQQKDSAPPPEIFIQAPFKSMYRICKLIYKTLNELYDKYGTTGKIFIELIKSLWESLKSTLKNLKNLFWNLIDFFGTIFKYPLDLIKNFSDYAEKLFTLIAKMILKIYYFLLRVLSPIYAIIKEFLKNILSIFRFPYKALVQLCSSLISALKSVARGVTKASKALLEILIDSIKRLAHYSYYIFEILLRPFKWLWNLLKSLYFKFSLIPFLKEIFYILIHLPRNLWNALCSICVYLYNMICIGIQFIVKTLIGMFLDICDFLHITEYLLKIIRPIYDVLYAIGIYLLDLLLEILVIPYHFVLWLFDLIRHPIQTLIDLFNSFINIIKQIASAIAQILTSNIIKFLVNLLTKPIDLLRQLFSMISFRGIIRIVTWPLKGLKYLGHLLSELGKSIVKLIIRISKSIKRGFDKLLEFLSQISLRRILELLIAPFKFIIKVLKYIFSNQFVQLIVRIIKNVLYIPVWLVSFLFRSIYFLIGSFVNLFNKDFSFENIFDMWDNACWPRDAEYCKKKLGKSQYNQNYNDNYRNDYNDDYYFDGFNDIDDHRYA